MGDRSPYADWRRRSGFRRVEKSDARTGEPARHVAQLLDALAFAEDYEVIKTTLPDVACFRRFFPQNGRDKLTHLSGPKLVEG